MTKSENLKYAKEKKRATFMSRNQSLKPKKNFCDIN